MAETVQDFTQSLDAHVWADAFIALVKEKPEIATDHGTMIAWFANAIMRGWDGHARRMEVEHLPSGPRSAPPLTGTPNE